MESRNNDVLDENRESLQHCLQSLRRQKRNNELIDLLVDMNAAGALVLRQKAGSVPEPLWFATGHAGFADRLFQLEDDLHALLIELFMDGVIAFTVRDQPQLHIWWETEAQQESRCRRPN